jgi:hypothetical protein
MKHLDKYATQLFLKALPKGDLDSVNTYNRRQRFRLTVCRMNDLLTPFGPASHFTFIQQDQQGIRCPEMRLLLMDHRTEQHASEDYVTVYPRVYIQDNLDIHQHSFSIRAGQFASFNAQAQADQVVFANDWMRVLQKEGLIR